MIIYFKFLFILFFFLNACNSPHANFYFSKFNISNIFFSFLYINTNSDLKDFDEYLKNNEILRNYDLSNFYICRGKCYKNKYPEIIKFYQDKEKTCFLYSYTSRELYNLEWELKKQLPRSIRFNTEIIIALEQNRAKAITKEEYEQNKDKYKSHPYDPSLCKPDPSYEELYKMKGIK